jgi:hypothetical protein
MSGEEATAWDQIPSLNHSIDDDNCAKLDIENRHYQRSSINELNNSLYDDISSLSIKLATASRGIFEGKILDFSASGCKIEVSKDLIKGELVKIRFEIDKHVIISKAICRWITLLEFKGCVAGLEFQSISSNQKEILNTISTATKFM